MLLIGVAQGRAGGSGAGQQAGGLSQHPSCQERKRAGLAAETLRAMSHTP